MNHEEISLHPNSKKLHWQTFGKLTAVAPVDRVKHNGVRWLCVCDCGTEHVVTAANLTNGHVQSCGCAASVSVTHGMWDTPAWRSWSSMLDRCNSPQAPNYGNYGGRGIRVCARWFSFENFYADMGARPKGKTLDRIDANGDYTPENCRWASLARQQRNRRNTKFLTFNDNTLSLPDWADKTGIHKDTISDRLRRGWSVADALTRPVQHKRHGTQALIAARLVSTSS